MIRGLSELIGDLARLPKEVEQEARQITETYGRLTHAEATEKAPVDLGELRRSGFYEPTNNGKGAKVTFSAGHGPYVEFGTGGLVSVPAGFEELASQYKGEGKRQVNLPARPFLIPTYLVNAEKYYQALGKMLERLLK